MQYRDVVIHTNTGIFGTERETNQFPPVQQRIDLSGQIWLGRLDGDVAKAIMETCEPKVFGMPSPVRQFAQLSARQKEDGPGQGVKPSPHGFNPCDPIPGSESHC
jgi:hypothetical protein